MNSLKKLIILMIIGLSISLSYAQQDDKDAKKVLLFAIPKLYVPFSLVDSMGTINGFSVAFVNDICKIMQVDCIFKPVALTDLSNQVATGAVDAAVGAVKILPSETFIYTIPYLVGEARFLVAYWDGNKFITGANDKALKKGRIGVLKGSVFKQFLTENYPDATVYEYKDLHQLILDLAENELSAAILDHFVANYWTNILPTHFYMLDTPLFLKDESGIGILLAKGNEKLKNRLDVAIAQFTKTQEYRDLVLTFIDPVSNPFKR